MTAYRIAASVAALWLGFAVAGAAQAAVPPGDEDCRLRTEAPVSNWIIRGYDPFGGAAATGDFELTLINDGSGECRVRPSLDTEQQPFGLGQGGAVRLSYALVNRTGNEDVTPRTGRTLVSPARPLVVVGPHGTQTLRFALAVATDQLGSDGLFSQNLRFDAERDDGGVAASRQLTIGLDVKPAALVGLAGQFVRSEGRAIVNLGELREGIAPVPLTLNVRSTRGFAISVESQNGGMLRLAGTDWSIPYGIAIDQRTLALGASATFTSATGTDLARRSIPLRFNIGNVSQKRAGTYSDVITISIAVE